MVKTPLLSLFNYRKNTLYPYDIWFFDLLHYVFHDIITTEPWSGGGKRFSVFLKIEKNSIEIIRIILKIKSCLPAKKRLKTFVKQFQYKQHKEVENFYVLFTYTLVGVIVKIYQVNDD